MKPPRFEPGRKWASIDVTQAPGTDSRTVEVAAGSDLAMVQQALETEYPGTQPGLRGLAAELEAQRGHVEALQRHVQIQEDLTCALQELRAAERELVQQERKKGPQKGGRRSKRPPDFPMLLKLVKQRVAEAVDTKPSEFLSWLADDQQKRLDARFLRLTGDARCPVEELRGATWERVSRRTLNDYIEGQRSSWRDS